MSNYGAATTTSDVVVVVKRPEENYPKKKYSFTEYPYDVKSDSDVKLAINVSNASNENIRPKFTLYPNRLYDSAKPLIPTGLPPPLNPDFRTASKDSRDTKGPEDADSQKRMIRPYAKSGGNERFADNAEIPASQPATRTSYALSAVKQYSSMYAEMPNTEMSPAVLSHATALQAQAPQGQPGAPAYESSKPYKGINLLELIRLPPKVNPDFREADGGDKSFKNADDRRPAGQLRYNSSPDYARAAPLGQVVEISYAPSAVEREQSRRITVEELGASSALSSAISSAVTSTISLTAPPVIAAYSVQTQPNYTATPAEEATQYVQQYIPLRRTRLDYNIQQQPIDEIPQLASADIVIGAAEYAGFDVDILKYALELRLALMKSRSFMEVGDPSLRQYNNESLNQNFQYSQKKAGDRPEIAVFKIKGDISDNAIYLVQEATELLNKHAKRDLKYLVQQLVKFTTRSNNPVLICDLIDMIIIEIFEKACIEIKFVEFYALVLIQYVDYLLARPDVTKIEAELGNYRGYYYQLLSYVVRFLTNTRLRPELQLKRPSDYRYATCRDTELLNTHFRLAIKFFSLLCVISRGKYVTPATGVNLLYILAKKLLYQCYASNKLEFDEKLLQSDEGFNNILSVLKQTSPQVIQSNSFIWGLIDHLTVSAAFLIERCHQEQKDMSLKFSRVRRVIELLISLKKLEEVQIFHFRNALGGSTISVPDCSSFYDNKPYRSFSLVRPLEDGDVKGWGVESLSFEQLCMSIMGLSSADEVIEALRSESGFSVIKKATTPLVDHALRNGRLGQLIRQSKRLIRASERSDYYIWMLDQCKKQYQWAQDDQKDRYTSDIAQSLADLLSIRQITFSYALKVDSSPGFMRELVRRIVREAYLEVLGELEEEGEPLGETRSRITNFQFSGLEELAELREFLSQDFAAIYRVPADGLRSTVKPPTAVSQTGDCEAAESVSEAIAEVTSEVAESTDPPAPSACCAQPVATVEATELIEATEPVETAYAAEAVEAAEPVQPIYPLTNTPENQLNDPLRLLLNAFERRAIAQLKALHGSLTNAERKDFAYRIAGSLNNIYYIDLDEFLQFFKNAGFAPGSYIVPEIRFPCGPKFCEAAAVSAASDAAPEPSEHVLKVLKFLGDLPFQLPAGFYFDAASQSNSANYYKIMFLRRFSHLFDLADFRAAYGRRLNFSKNARIPWADAFLDSHSD